MKYLVRERIFSFADRFNIQDEDGSDKFQVEGQLFSLGDKLRIYDLDGRELIYIEQQIWRLLPEYNIYRGDRLLARVKKELTLFKPRFTIESQYGDFTIDGDVFAHDFTILNNGRPIAWVSKKWFSLSDTYYVEILEGEDHAFILSLVIVLDQVLYDESGNNR
ncbi:MAG: hypothetical protein GX069_00050 [Tissierellia bacterium]|nr:hypothetical protein [Tissierellia bacterium]